MQWNRSNAIGVAKASCSYCHGNGIRFANQEMESPCNCVFRAVFRACFNKFKQCASLGSHTSSVSLEFVGGAGSRRMYSRKREEFMADFCLVSERSLNAKDHQLFRYHFLLGADWKLCCRQMKMDRGNFFHAVYRIEQRLGRVFAELKPFPLFPVNEYFSTVIRKESVASSLLERLKLSA